MFWGSFSFSVVTSLMPIEGMMNLYKYIDVIGRKPIPDMRKAFADGGGNSNRILSGVFLLKKWRRFSGSKIKSDRLTWKLGRSEPHWDIMIMKKIPVTKIISHHHDQAYRGHHSSMASRVAESEVKCLTPAPTFPKFPLQLRPFQSFRLLNIKWMKFGGRLAVAANTQWKSWYTARILCFNKSFIRNCTDSTGIPNLGMWCKSDPIGLS